MVSLQLVSLIVVYYYCYYYYFVITITFTIIVLIVNTFTLLYQKLKSLMMRIGSMIMYL